MTDLELQTAIITAYNKKYPRARAKKSYAEYVREMNRAELEFEYTLNNGSYWANR